MTTPTLERGETTTLVHYMYYSWECKNGISLESIWPFCKHILTMWATNSISRYLPKLNENICLHMHEYTYHQNLKIIQM